jgi:hypothetical protein
MTDDHHDGEHVGVTRGEAAVQDLLSEDAATWRRLVPANDRLNSRVRTLTNVAGGTTHPQDRESADIHPPAATISVRESARPRPATRGALVAALLVVGLLAMILYGRTGENTSNPGSVATSVAIPTLTAESLGPPIPGPAAGWSYVKDTKTARGGVANFEPIGVTSRFQVGEGVFWGSPICADCPGSRSTHAWCNGISAPCKFCRQARNRRV